MKQLIFSMALLALASCHKTSICDENTQTSCIYIQFSFTDCTPNSSELGWDYDEVRSDTIYFETFGCPETIESDFRLNQQRVLHDSTTPENIKKFLQMYPSSCNCY